MKLRYKVAGGIFALLGIAVFALALALSHTAACEPAPALSAEGETMQAIVYRCYGPPEVLSLEQIEKPTPAADEVLVRVGAASVNPLDWHFMRGSPYIMRLMSGMGRPLNNRMGRDFAGTVESVGAEVERFKAGDRVFGGANGAFAEYVVVRKDRSIAHIPPGVSFEQAAALPVAAITALQALRDKGQLQASQKVLINGASGGVGTYAVQIAKSLGAEVHGVCSTRNVELVTSLGADRVFDYKRETYTESGELYDLIIDNVGNHSLRANRRVLKPDGTLVMVGGQSGNWIGPFSGSLEAMVLRPFVPQQFLSILARLNAADLAILAELMAGQQIRSAIDQRFTLEQAQDALGYSESGRVRGKIVFNLD